ncbi:hypothetical protein RFI_28135 [Reticulomyxa filosa]|uniref:Uncharacterized protein n=1 Tax=Reticulomyxa filosa TaxID=46433 RepID=X6M5I5_RETFI|nr:hypothetical protein RFI_28135 [Reticulomyxa filosa]|eukprot:ETO09253.1 hypothetical protein RFI_28135 [Reticulomyxa filosa]
MRGSLVDISNTYQNFHLPDEKCITVNKAEKFNITPMQSQVIQSQNSFGPHKHSTFLFVCFCFCFFFANLIVVCLSVFPENSTYTLVFLFVTVNKNFETPAFVLYPHPTQTHLGNSFEKLNCENCLQLLNQANRTNDVIMLYDCCEYVLKNLSEVSFEHWTHLQWQDFKCLLLFGLNHSADTVYFGGELIVIYLKSLTMVNKSTAMLK